MLSEPWCECNVNGKGKLMRTYTTEVMSEVIQSTRVVKRRILRQHELVNSKQHVSDKTDPMFCEPGGE